MSSILVFSAHVLTFLVFDFVGSLCLVTLRFGALLVIFYTSCAEGSVGGVRFVAFESSMALVFFVLLLLSSFFNMFTAIRSQTTFHRLYSLIWIIVQYHSSYTIVSLGL